MRWERDELYIADVHGFISPSGSGSNRSFLGQGNEDTDTGYYSQLAGHRSVYRHELLACGSMCYSVNS